MKQFFKYMMASLCALILFGVFCFFMAIGSLATMLTLGSTSTPTLVKEHSVYELELRGTISERSDADPYQAIILEAMGNEQDPVYGLNDILASIRKAKENPNIDGIWLHGGSLAMGSATAKAIRDALIDFRSSGKFIIAYADTYGQQNYYLASVANRLYVNPSGSIDWHGMSANLQFYPRLLEKLGVEMQVVKVGTFKSAVEPFILTGMSDANKLQYNVLLQDQWQTYTQAISLSRNISIDQLNALADRFMALQPSEELVSSHMADSTCYVQDIHNVLAQLTGTEDFNLLSHTDMLSVQEDLPTGDKVAILYAEGDITDEKGEGIVGKKMVKDIQDLMDDDDIKAVVLRVNSGGGSAYASEQIHHAIALLKEKKPVVVSMGDYAASGGYYISCNANYIYAEPNTLTGSIGIFGLIPNFGGLANKVGVDFDGIKTHQHADLESNMVLRGMNPTERAMMQAEINRGYDLFTRRCAEGRGLTQDSIKVIGEGRVWTGRRALAIGLVDSLGNISDAINKAAELANLTDYQTVEYPEPEDMMTQLMKAFSGEARADRIMEHQLGRETYQALRYTQQLRDAARIQARMPYIIFE